MNKINGWVSQYLCVYLLHDFKSYIVFVDTITSSIAAIPLQLLFVKDFLWSPPDVDLVNAPTISMRSLWTIFLQVACGMADIAICTYVILSSIIFSTLKRPFLVLFTCSLTLSTNLKQVAPGSRTIKLNFVISAYLSDCRTTLHLSRRVLTTKAATMPSWQ